MKAILAYFVLLIFNGTLFVFNHAFISWFGALTSVGFLFYFAATYQKPKYRWLVAYEFAGGNGRIFIEANAKNLSKQFILDVENYLRDNEGIDNPGISNIQFLERSR